jgi:hypothetical protein
MEQQHDFILRCVDCQADFIFTVAEQRFFESKQLSVPKRCKTCRAERKARLVPDQAVNHGH